MNTFKLELQYWREELIKAWGQGKQTRGDEIRDIINRIEELKQIAE